MSFNKLSAGLVGVCLLFAQAVSAQGADDVESTNYSGAPRIEKDPTISLTLPPDLPLAGSPSAMTEYLVPDLKQRFTFDPASFRLTGKVVMLTVTATSNSGASTTGYYAINCDNGEYKLLGYPSTGKWKASTRTRWRKVLGIKRRPSQLVPLYAAGCEATEPAVRNATEFTSRLEELSDQ